MKLLDAASAILVEVGVPLPVTELTRRMIEQGLWQPRGKTPIASGRSLRRRRMTTWWRRSAFSASSCARLRTHPGDVRRRWSRPEAVAEDVPYARDDRGQTLAATSQKHHQAMPPAAILAGRWAGGIGDAGRGAMADEL